MNGYEFIEGNPFTALAILSLVTGTIYYGFVRLMRAVNIHKQGWPPPHCDADGDATCGYGNEKDVL